MFQIYVRLIQACNFQYILNHFFVFWCNSTYLEHREKRPLFHAIAKVLLYGQVGCLFTSFIVMSLDFPFSKILMLSFSSPAVVHSMFNVYRVINWFRLIGYKWFHMLHNLLSISSKYLLIYTIYLPNCNRWWALHYTAYSENSALQF